MIMKKKITLALAFVPVLSIAAPRTQDEAREIAADFLTRTVSPARPVTSHSLALSPYTTARSVARVKGAQQSLPYYIFNIEDEGGFVIVSGDDRFRSVLGYSNTGSFGGDVPAPVEYWLSFLEREMESALSYYEANGITAVEHQQRYAVDASQDIRPLVRSHWNQTAPWNNLVPVTLADGSKAPTGCIATGMTQVMRYWQWPVHGKGRHANATTPSAAVDFSQATYNWDVMLDNYGWYYDFDGSRKRQSYTEDKSIPAATINYHAGVATDMMWNYEGGGSSATTNVAALSALINNFDYNPYTHIESRDVYSYGAFKAMLLDELTNGRPVLYSGSSKESNVGHFFICDGYDCASGFFHFNWGWAGTYDGYYSITALEPGIGGAGAGMGSYNDTQEIIVGLQPKAAGEETVSFVAQSMKAQTSWKRGESSRILLTELTNNSIGFAGTIGVVLKQGGTAVAMKMVDNNLRPGNTVMMHVLETPKFGSSIAPGEYTMSVMTYSKATGKYHAVPAYYGTPSSWKVTVTAAAPGSADGTVTCEPISNMAELTADASPVLLSSNDGMIYDGHEALFSVTVKNTGSCDFCDELGVLVKKGRSSVNQQYFLVPARIASGETVTVRVGGRVSLAEGTGYTATVCYGDNQYYSNISDGLSLTVGSDADNIANVTAGATPVRTEYFTLSGLRVSTPQQGAVIIRRTLFSDGSARTDKMRY